MAAAPVLPFLKYQPAQIKQLGRRQAVVLEALEFRSNKEGRMFHCTSQWLEAKTGYSDRTICRALSDLEGARRIGKKPDRYGNQIYLPRYAKVAVEVRQNGVLEAPASINLLKQELKKKTTTTRPGPVEVPAPVVVPPENPIIATIAQEAGPTVANRAKNLPAEKVEEAVAAAQEYRSDLKRHGKDSNAAKVFSRALCEGWKPNTPRPAAVPVARKPDPVPTSRCERCRMPIRPEDPVFEGHCMDCEEREAIAAEGKSAKLSDLNEPPPKGQPESWTRKKYNEWVNSQVGPSIPQGPAKPETVGNIPRAASIMEEMEVLQRALRGPAWRDDGGKPWKP